MAARVCSRASSVETVPSPGPEAGLATIHPRVPQSAPSGYQTFVVLAIS
jgi:hypothetical protein